MTTQQGDSILLHEIGNHHMYFGSVDDESWVDLALRTVQPSLIVVSSNLI